MRYFVGLLVLMLVGCGGTQRTKVGDAQQSTERKPTLPPPGTFMGLGSTEYAPKSLKLAPLSVELRRQLKQAIPAPPALDCLAQEYATRFAVDGRDPDLKTVQALAHHCGYWSLPKLTHTVTALNRETVDAYLAKLPIELLSGAVAIGALKHPDGRVTVALIKGPGDLTLNPVLRHPPPGPLTITGQALRADGTLELWVARGDERPKKLRLERGPNGKFTGSVLIDKSTINRVEITRRTGRFRHTIALLHLGQPAQSYSVGAAPGAIDASAFFNAVSAARKARGVDPLTHAAHLDSQLDRWMASAYRTGSANKAPGGMVDSEGSPYVRLRYTFASGSDAAQAIDLLSQIPTGRRALYAMDDQEIAFGVRPFATGKGVDAIMVTLRRFELAALPGSHAVVKAKLDAARAAAKVRPLKSAASLDELAQANADAVLAGRLPWKKTVPNTMSMIREHKMARGSFSAGAFTVVGPDATDFAEEAHALAPEMAFVGIGVSAGRLPNGGPPRYVVVYVVVEKLPKEGS